MTTDNPTSPATNGGRPSAVWLHIGAKRTGKTRFTLEVCQEMQVKQGKPTLIFDIGNQNEYDAFTPVELYDLKYFNGIVREAKDRQQSLTFRCRSTDIDEFFYEVNQYVRNAFVVFEDATSYMAGNLTEPRKRLVLNSRNVSNDYFFNLHSLSGPAPFLYLYSEYIILRQTSDNAFSLPGKVPVPYKVRLAMLDIQEENAELYPLPAQPKLAYRLINLQSL